MSEVVHVIFEGFPDDSTSATLPVNFGSLGGDVLFVHRFLDENGDPAVGNYTYAFADRVSSGNQLGNILNNDFAGQLFHAAIRTPGTQYQN